MMHAFDQTVHIHDVKKCLDKIKTKLLYSEVDFYLHKNHKAYTILNMLPLPLCLLYIMLKLLTNVTG